MADLSLNLAPGAQPATPSRLTVSRIGGLWPVRVLIMWLLLATMLLIVDAHSIATERFADPDDALRLMEVQDWLAGQSWFDVHQYRIAAPEGVPMHWSRLVDLPIAAMIVLLRPLLGTPMAELVTVVSVPLLTLLATLMLVGRLAAKFFDTETVGIACLVTGTGAQLLFQMTPLRVDHHGWQVVLALVALNGLAARDALRGGLVIGVSLAALLSISIEGLPITAVFLGVLALRGLIGPGARQFTGFAAAGTMLALASVAIFLGTRGVGDLVTHCDQISPVHLALFGIVAIGSAALAAWSPRRWPLAVGALGTIGAVALGTYLWAAPQCRGGAFVALDPMVYKFWYESVGEGLPFWRLPVPIAVETVGVPLVGLFSTFMLWRAATDPAERAWWRDHALVLTGALLIAASLERASATASGIAAVSTGAMLMRWMIALRTIPPARRTLGYLGLLTMLLPPLPVVAWNVAAAHLTHTSNETAGQSPITRCNYPVAARALNTLPATDLFLPLDIGPAILVRTHHRVVATGHHRGAAAMHDVIAAFLGMPDEAHAIIHRRHATWIAICPDLGEPSNYKFYAPKGLMTQLINGNPPPWLQPVDLAPGSNMLFWKVTG